MGRLTSPRWFGADNNSPSLAEWRRHVFPVAAVCTLCCKETAISGEFIPDMIIAVKLQPAADKHDEHWQVKCARSQSMHVIHLKCFYARERNDAQRANPHSFKVPRSTPDLFVCGGGVIRCFAVNKDLGPLCEHVTPVTEQRLNRVADLSFPLGCRHVQFTEKSNQAVYAYHVNLVSMVISCTK